MYLVVLEKSFLTMYFKLVLGWFKICIIKHKRLYIVPGFFPAEMVFTERAIPTLVAAGLEWVIVANNHISRSCKVSR